MEPLNKQENDVLELLCSDSVALENFLIESENPRLLPFLNGDNKYNLDIFNKGFIPNAPHWKCHSSFWLPTTYLKKIVDRLDKETNISSSIRQEYSVCIQKALHDIIKGYTAENKEDSSVVQMILHIIQVQDITFLDKETFVFMVKSLKLKDSSLYIHNINQILHKMLLQEVNINDIKQCIELMIELLPNEYVSSDYTSDSIKEFLLNPEVIAKLSDIADDAFLSKLADILTQTLGQEKDISIIDGIDIKIQDDCSLKIKISGTTIEFILPYYEFKDKKDIIAPIVKEALKDYTGTIKNLYEKIIYWYTYIWSDLTYVTYPSLYDKPKGYYQRRQGVLICLLKEILLIRLKTQGLDKFREIYKTITTKNKYFVFKRILLYCYGKEFEKMRDVLFELIEQEKYLLFSLYFDAETYNLLRENVSKFTQIEKEKIERIIEEGPYEERIWDLDGLDNTARIKRRHYWQQQRYAPLNEVEPFKQKYENLLQQTHMKEFFNFRDGMGMKPLHYKSLLQDTEVLALLENEPDKYVNKIIEFAKNPPNKVNASIHEMPHPEGNAEQLQRLANSYPAIITESINNLSDLKPVYIRHILYGLRDTKDRKNIKWDKLCSFVENYVDKLSKNGAVYQDTKEDQDDIIDVPKGHDMDYVIGAWADIIREDQDSFNISELRESLLKYLKLLLKNYSFDYNPISYIQDGKKCPVDYLTLSINTVVGKVLEKLIRVVLSENARNPSVLKDIYDEMLEKKVVEAHVFLGLYFVFFHQNMKEWTKKKTDLFLKLSDNEDTAKYWEMFFEGFIRSNKQYLSYYELMSEHYKKAIEQYSGYGQDRLIDLLMQFFEYDKDDLNNNSLISFCWNKKKFHILSGCVREFSFSLNQGKSYDETTPNEKEREQEKKITAKAENLWRFLWERIDHEHISLIESPSEQKKLFVGMLELIPALPSLDNATEGKIAQIIDCADTISWGMANLLSNLIYLVEKNNYRETEILNLAKIYHKIIEKINYFIKHEQHFKIIELLKKYIDNTNIKEQFNLIRAIYVNRKWNQYLDWFLNDTQNS